MIPAKSKKVLITDFDGTIIKKDFFWYIIEKLMTEEDIKPWKDYLTRKITHFDALNLIFQKIHLNEEELHKIILELPVEECFTELVDFCNAENIDIYIVSAGADYYINIILDFLGVKNSVNLIANESTYSKKDGLQMIKLPEDSIFYSENYGISKEAVMKFLKSRYELTIFAGDGTPDYNAALRADVVFARGTLLELCKEHNINYIELDSYCKIFDYLKMGE
jgi:2,3-diketo-5-methylthio-1-phosphopentane phosphatase